MTVRQALQSLESRGLLASLRSAATAARSSRGRRSSAISARSAASRSSSRGRASRRARASCRRARWTVRSRSSGCASPMASRSRSSARAFPRIAFAACSSSTSRARCTSCSAHFDAAPVRAVERIEPVLADADDAAALGFRVGAPLMLVDRVAYDDAGSSSRRRATSSAATARASSRGRRSSCARDDVVIGGGIAGVSCAYHLAKAGVKDSCSSRRAS